MNDLLIKLNTMNIDISNKQTQDTFQRLKILYKSQVPIIESIIRQTQDIYPENWELQLSYIGQYRHLGFRLFLVIRFPEIQIKNSRSSSHTIRDIYVHVALTSSGNFHITNIQGIRGKADRYEIGLKYLHSHLHTKDYTSESSYILDKFCLGEGEINHTIMILNTGYDANRFRLFLFQLKSYLEWESLEGTPYISMDRLIYGESSSNNPTDEGIIIKMLRLIDDSIRLGFSSSVYDLYTKIDVKVNSDNEIEIIQDANYHDFLLALYKSSSSNPPSFILHVDSDGNIVDKKITQKFRGAILEGKFIFNRRVNNVEIIEDSNEPNIVLQEVLHPKLREIITTRLTNEFNKNAIKITAYQ